jgi:hypothetical protein
MAQGNRARCRITGPDNVPIERQRGKRGFVDLGRDLGQGQEDRTAVVGVRLYVDLYPPLFC